jgi:hypothetical protein
MIGQSNRQTASQAVDLTLRIFAQGCDADAYSPFRLLKERSQFLDLILSNEDMGNLSVEDEFTVPTAEEIRNAGLGPRRTV